jgi:hypothetical protein
MPRSARWAVRAAAGPGPWACLTPPADEGRAAVAAALRSRLFPYAVESLLAGYGAGR